MRLEKVGTRHFRFIFPYCGKSSKMVLTHAVRHLEREGKTGQEIAKIVAQCEFFGFTDVALQHESMVK